MHNSTLLITRDLKILITPDSTTLDTIWLNAFLNHTYSNIFKLIEFLTLYSLLKIRYKEYTIYVSLFMPVGQTFCFPMSFIFLTWRNISISSGIETLLFVEWSIPRSRRIIDTWYLHGPYDLQLFWTFL
jgi:hypothetical protein